MGGRIRPAILFVSIARASRLPGSHGNRNLETHCVWMGGGGFFAKNMDPSVSLMPPLHDRY